MLIVSLVILLFLWHIPSAIVPIVTIPVSVLLAFIPMYLHGHHLQHHVAGRHRDLDRRAGRRRDRRGRERLQEARAAGSAGGPQGRLPRGAAARRCKEVGPVGLLLAARDRRRVPADLHARGPGGPAVQAAGLHQEPRHGDRRAAGDHARPRAAHALHAHGLRSRSGRAGWPGSSTRSLVGTLLPRGAAPDQPAPVPALRAGRAASCCGIRRRRSSWRVAARRDDRPRLPARSGSRVHAAAQRGHDPLHADHAARHLGDRGAAHAADQDRILQSVPRGRARVRQGGPRRDLDRPGAVLDDGDDGRAEAAESEWRAKQRWYSDWAPEWLQGLCCAASGPTASPARSWSTRWTARCASPA